MVLNFDESPFKMSSDNVHNVDPMGFKESVLIFDALTD
jgi:hypothetical protein